MTKYYLVNMLLLIEFSLCLKSQQVEQVLVALKDEIKRIDDSNPRYYLKLDILKAFEKYKSKIERLKKLSEKNQSIKESVSYKKQLLQLHEKKS